MPPQHASWKHTGLAFGCGLVLFKPPVLLLVALGLAGLLGARWLFLALRRHWPGIPDFLHLAADFLVLLWLLLLILSVLWLMPVFEP